MKSEFFSIFIYISNTISPRNIFYNKTLVTKPNQNLNIF